MVALKQLTDCTRMFLASSVAPFAKLDFTGCILHQKVITSFGIFNQNEQWLTTKLRLKLEKKGIPKQELFIWAYFIIYNKVSLSGTLEPARL